MEIGNEISQKVRSAIKAKLVDLGAYVDDELPDYIMVMVANKKTREQMTDDLNLFLGNNTERFTAWLSTLLEKLHSVETSTPESKPSDAPRDPPNTEGTLEHSAPSTTDTAKPEALTETSRTRGSSTAEQGAPAKKVDRQHGQATFGDAGRKRATSEGQGAANTSPQGAKRSRVSEGSEKEKTEDSLPENVPEILIAAEKDLLFEEEVEASTKMQLSRQQSDNKDRASKSHSNAAPKTGIASPIRVTKDVVPPKGRTSVRTSSDHRTRSSKSGDSDVGGSSSDTSRRKRPLSSAIGAIVKRPSQDVVEEPYDPYRPAIGKVASQVKITERKSKVPLTWQADKSILLKAVSAAEHSIEKSKKEKAVVKPVSHESPPKKHKSSVHQRLSHRSHSPPRGLRSERYSSRRSPPRHRESRHDRISGERKIQVFSRSKDDDVFSRLRSKVMVKKAEKAAEASREEEDGKGDKDSTASSVKSEASSEAEGTEKKEHVAPEDVLDLGIPEDSRLIEYELEEDQTSKPSVPSYKATPISRSLGMLVESGAEESDFTDGEGEDSRIVKEQQRSARLEDRSESPKFVVTLDGVDPKLLKKEVKFDCESDHEVEPELSPPKPERNIVRVEPRPQRPMIQPTTVVNLQDDDFEDEDSEMIDVSELREKPTLAERCHFWPSCKNGETCMYHHPTETCRNFPKCKFADKCFYVHPNCKFDAVCSKPNCPFTHTSKKPPAAFAPSVPVFVQPIKVPVYAGGFFPPARPPRPSAPQQPGQVTCKFFPECTNMNCPYSHPKPCRFGVSCNNKSTCHFTHPKMPSKDQLSWSKSAKSQASFLPSPGVSPILTSKEGPFASSPKT